MPHDENLLLEEVPTNRFADWPPAQALPEAVVKASFSGLLAFCYNDDKECEIGVHRADGRHQLRIEILEDDVPLSIVLPTPIRTLSLGIRIAGQEKPANVLFLKDGGEKDFRWVVDLESDEFYSQGYDKKPVFDAILRVRHGVFFTRKRTKFVLDKVQTFPIGFLRLDSLSRPGDDIAVNIELAANEYVSLVVNEDEIIQLLASAGKSYEVRFIHDCREHNQICHFQSDSWLESSRNDFHFHRDALSLGVFKARYSLVVAPGQLAEPNAMSDESPCMGAGFGRTGGFPPAE